MGTTDLHWTPVISGRRSIKLFVRIRSIGIDRGFRRWIPRSWIICYSDSSLDDPIVIHAKLRLFWKISFIARHNGLMSHKSETFFTRWGQNADKFFPFEAPKMWFSCNRIILNILQGSISKHGRSGLGGEDSTTTLRRIVRNQRHRGPGRLLTQVACFKHPR